jgi:hypothetical protein
MVSIPRRIPLLEVTWSGKCSIGCFEVQAVGQPESLGSRGEGPVDVCRTSKNNGVCTRVLWAFQACSKFLGLSGCGRCRSEGPTLLRWQACEKEDLCELLVQTVVRSLI